MMRSLINSYPEDKIVFEPKDVDLNHSPLRASLSEKTSVLGAFNPGATRLPNGNLLLMVRIAETLQNTIQSDQFRIIRWDPLEGYILDAYDLNDVDISDPRKILLKAYKPQNVYALTSISWLLPVEFDMMGLKVVQIHYDKAIHPSNINQEYGIEDARIAKINSTYYMTVCSVSSFRHSTGLYSSKNGLDYRYEGMILDHQNKDMTLFEGAINGYFYALTRPLGNSFLVPSPHSGLWPGPSINLSRSPDLLHWKPVENPLIYLSKMDGPNLKLGGGTPPILTKDGWLVLFHGVQSKGEVGSYSTYWAILDADHPEHIVHINMMDPVLQSDPALTYAISDLIYLKDVVFTTGIVESKDHYIVASGELDLCCRISHIPKNRFILN
jgi:predicted GH43/DUF377 family glycosyl hydrolase